MKHLKRVLCVILTVAMLLTAAPLTVGADTGAAAVVYDTVLFEQDFDSIAAGTSASELEHLTYQGSKSAVTDTVESAAAVGINGADDHGIVVQLHKTDTGEETQDNYFRLLYRNASATKGEYGLIDGMFLNAPQVLGKVKTGIDVYYKGALDILNFRFYDNLTGEGTLKAENLASIQADGTVKLAGSAKVPELVIQPDTWYTLDFELDFAAGSYSLAINGTTCASGVSFTVLDTCVTSFGVQNNTKNAYDIYLDNMSFAVADIVPQSTNLVWENDFDDVELISGSTEGENADIDYKPENADWAIKEEADGNRYYYFQPQSTSDSNTNSGNREDSYFKTSQTEVRIQKTDENGVGLVDQKGNPIYYTGLEYPSSWDETPYGIDTFKLDKLVLDFSIKFNALMEMQVCSYYRGTMYGEFNAAAKLLHFNDDGIIGIGTDNISTDATYEPDKWLDVSMYINFADHYVTYYVDNQYLGITTLSEIKSHFSQIRFRIDKAATENFESYGVSLDNIRYSTPYSVAYINRNPYTQQIAYVDYKDVAAGTVLNSTTDPSKYQFSTDAVSGTVVYDKEKGHNVLFYDKSAGQGTGTGVTAAAPKASDVYKKYNKYPDVVRVETEVKRAVTTAIYVHIQGKEIMMHGGSSKIQFKNGGTRVPTTVDPGQNNWYTVAFDLDFVSGTYDAYYNGTLMADDYTIPTGITAPENIVISSNDVQNNAYVNYISVGALPPYGADSLCEYFDINADWQIGYAMNNDGASDATHKLIAAKYDNNGNLVEISAIEDKTIKAGAYSVCSTPLTEAADGYYKYFVWADLDTIKPLLSNEIIK